jgi:SnoaL-like polyketide cyclase
MSDPPSASSLDLEPVVRAVLVMMATGQADDLALVTEDVAMRGPMADVDGRDQLRTHLSDWRDGLSDVEIVVDRIAVDGVAAIVDWHFTGRHTGVALLMEDMLFDPTGNDVSVSVTTELVFRGQQIGSLRHDYDLDELVRQLRPDPGA